MYAIVGLLKFSIQFSQTVCKQYNKTLPIYHGSVLQDIVSCTIRAHVNFI